MLKLLKLLQVVPNSRSAFWKRVDELESRCHLMAELFSSGFLFGTLGSPTDANLTVSAVEMPPITVGKVKPTENTKRRKQMKEPIEIENQDAIQTLEKKEYQSPTCEQHKPLEHVRAFRDKSSELVF